MPRIWDRLGGSHWFVPGVMAVLAVLLSQLMLWSDVQIPNEACSGRRFIFSADPDQARTT